MTGVLAVIATNSQSYGSPNWGNISAFNSGNNSGSAHNAGRSVTLTIGISSYSNTAGATLDLSRVVSGSPTSLGSVTGNNASFASFSHPVGQPLYFSATITGAPADTANYTVTVSWPGGSDTFTVGLSVS